MPQWGYAVELVSESSDPGESLSKVYDYATLLNPGASLDVITLKNGNWESTVKKKVGIL
jgi:hypothetical protein